MLYCTISRGNGNPAGHHEVIDTLSQNEQIMCMWNYLINLYVCCKLTDIVYQKSFHFCMMWIHDQLDAHKVIPSAFDRIQTDEQFLQLCHTIKITAKRGLPTERWYYVMAIDVIVVIH